jgi:hypothetical protein
MLSFPAVLKKLFSFCASFVYFFEVHSMLACCAKCSVHLKTSFVHQILATYYTLGGYP